jgi:hypothetical protein
MFQPTNEEENNLNIYRHTQHVHDILTCEIHLSHSHKFVEQNYLTIRNYTASVPDRLLLR